MVKEFRKKEVRGMNITVRSDGNLVQSLVECIHGKAFKTTSPREKYTLLRKTAGFFAMFREKSAHFYRFGCLLPAGDLT